MITGFHHFEITTADADRQAAFYGEHFGMVLVSDREIAPGGFTEKVTGVPGARVRIVHLQGWGLNFELLEYREPGGDTRAREPNHAGSAHLCFVTDDIEADCARLEAKGVRLPLARARHRRRRPQRRRQGAVSRGSGRQRRRARAARTPVAGGRGLAWRPGSPAELRS